MNAEKTTDYSVYRNDDSILIRVPSKLKIKFFKVVNKKKIASASVYIRKFIQKTCDKEGENEQ